MGWEKVKLGELLEKHSVKAKTFDGFERLPFYGVSNETGITISKYAAEDKAEDYKLLEKDCFAFNPYRVNVGSIALLTSEKKGLISPAYVVFKPKQKSIVPELLLKFLKSKEGLRQIKLHARGTVRQALRFEDLCKIELGLPSYEEQLDFFSSYEENEKKTDSLLDEQSYQLTLLKKLRQQILQDAVMGKLVEQDPDDEPASVLLEKIAEEKQKLIAEGKIKKGKPLPYIAEEDKPFDIPASWEWCRMGEITNLVTSGSRDWAKYYSDGGAIFVRMGNLSKDSFNLRLDKIQYVQPPNNSEGKRTKLEAGDILVSITGEVGNLGLIPQDFGEAYINQHTGLVRLNKSIDNIYVAEAFLSKLLQDQFDAPQRGMKNSFRLTDIDFLLIPLPPLYEQHRIVAKVEQLMKICDDLEQSIQQNRKYTQDLLQVALKEALEPPEES